MTQFYLDTSVAMRILLGQSPPAAKWFDGAISSSSDEVVSSRLLRTEITRALRRIGMQPARRDAILDYVGVVPLDQGILREAEAIVPHVKTLDAIHLASTLRLAADDVVVCTHDKAMAVTARELGLETMDPVTDDGLTAG